MTTTARQEDTRRYASAKAHRDAHPKKKRAARENGVSGRTEYRWGTPKDAKGSPLEKYSAYLLASQDPYRLIARNKAEVERMKAEKMTRDEVILRIRELHVQDPIQEAVDASNRARRGLRWRDRAVDAERDVAINAELAGLYLRAEELRITEAEVFGA